MAMAKMGDKSPLRMVFVFGVIGLMFLSEASASFPYYGTKIGPLKRLHHGVSGDVYAVDSRTLFIKGFNYDGEAPAAYFYVGNTKKPSNEGAHRLRDERGGTASLTKRYRNKDITLSLPEGKTLRDIKWFSVWCDEFAVNFGDVSIPANLDFPRPQKIAALKGVHEISSDNIVAVDAQTLLVPNFSFDGGAPDAKFWVGRGQNPTPQGLRIPDENGKETPLRRYDRKTIVLTLPGDLTIFDIGHFGVWCEAFTVDFAHILIPEGLNVPPSLKMLGISPQSKLNCEVLYDDLAFEVRWAVAGESIVVQLVAKLGKDEYMSFGISPTKNHSVMVGSDIVVAWVDKETGKGFAQDYYLDAKAQCSGGRGSCPDVNIEQNTNSIRLLNAAMVNDYSIVTYQRSLQATDRLDLPIPVNGSQAIVWAIGPLNERKEVSFHTQYLKQTHSIDFGRQPTWNCPMPEGSKPMDSDSDSDEEDEEDTTSDSDNNSGERTSERESNSPPRTTTTTEPEEEFYDSHAQALQRPTRRQGSARPVPTPKPSGAEVPWDIPAIQCHEPEDGVFYAQMGPTGGKHGYPAITGHVGWGISWYINGLLIPEIHVVRGKTYTFVVEGGNTPDIPAKYHPFYITDDPVGGYEHKREEEKKNIRIFAGVHRSRSGQVTPIGVGRLCNWTPDVDGPPADDYQSFGAYQRTLTLKCDPGEPGVITWKPDKNTPDTVYYHCFTHRYLGWKIHVHDSCDDERYAASERHEIRIPAISEAAEDYDAQSSVRHETKVSPNDNFLLKHQTDLIKNHNMNGTPPKLTFEITKSSELTKLISDGIRAAEALEDSIIIRNNNGNSNDPYPADSSNSNTANKHRYKPTMHKKPNNAAEAGSGLPHSIHHQLTASDLLHGEKTHSLNSINNHHYSQNSHANAPPPPHLSNPHIHAKTYNSPSQTNQHQHSTIQHNQQPNHHAPHLYHYHHQSNNVTNLPANSQKPIGLSEYLRPPQNSPLFHPVKLPGRRPFPGPIKKNSYVKPILPQQLPRRPSLMHMAPQQSSIIESGAIPQSPYLVNHYHKPMPGLLKSFLKEKPLPIQPLAASVLLLGQPIDFGTKKRKTEPLPLLGHKPKPIMPVPYSDLLPQDSFQANILSLRPEKKKPIHAVKIPTNEKRPHLALSTSAPATVFKEPFDIHHISAEPSSKELGDMKPAVNKGFQPDSVVVESGFRPIIRRDGTSSPANVDQVASRREDAGSEIDEVMETDTLFLTAGHSGTQTQNFEPMFIPSPLDSTNGTASLPKPVASQTFLSIRPATGAVRGESAGSKLPQMAELRNATLADLFGEPELEFSDERTNIENKTSSELPEETKSNFTEASDRIDEEISDTDESKHLDEDELEFDEMEDESFAGMDDEYEEQEAQAAERVDTYYLPPDNRKIPHAQIPSGAVITFDGKSVIDNTLVLPPKIDTRDTSNPHRTQPVSKLEQLIRSTPQFAPFRGEVPPSIPEFLSTENNIKLNLNPTSVATSSKITSPTPPPPTALSSLPSPTRSILHPISTKLQIVKNSA